MSMTFYAYRETAQGAALSDGHNFSNANARMILRSLGYGDEILKNWADRFAPAEAILRAGGAVAFLPSWLSHKGSGRCRNARRAALAPLTTRTRSRGKPYRPVAEKCM